MQLQQSVLEMAKDLVEAQIQAGQLAPNNIYKALQDTHAELMIRQARADRVEAGDIAVTGRASGSIDWRQSITRYAITCLECEAVFKQLSIRHLRKHDLDARSYRAKYGIPRTQSLAAKATTARRRQIMQEARPWEKIPRHRETQARKPTVVVADGGEAE